MSRVVRTDDDVYNVNGIFLGPRGTTLPWAARYQAYGVFAVIFPVVLLVDAIIGGLSVPPIWPLVLSVLGTYGVMGIVDHDRPVRTVLSSALADTRALRPQSSKPEHVRYRTRVRSTS